MPGYDPNHFYRDTDPITDQNGHVVDPLDSNPDIARTGLPGQAGSGQRINVPHSLTMDQIAAVARESESMSPENRRIVEKYADELKISGVAKQVKGSSKSWNIPAPWLDH